MTQVAAHPAVGGSAPPLRHRLGKPRTAAPCCSLCPTAILPLLPTFNLVFSALCAPLQATSTARLLSTPPPPAALASAPPVPACWVLGLGCWAASFWLTP